MRQKLYAAFGITAALVLLTHSGRAWGGSEKKGLNVLAFNYSTASESTLRGAEVETSRILAMSGIQLRWIQCAAIVRPALPLACQSEARSAQIRVRILDKSAGGVFHDGIFGFATHPIFATVYYESALLLAQRSTDSASSVSTILGCLIAHEMGHLLLGANQHTASGLMQAQWDIGQIKRAMMGTLLFTPEQSRMMLRNVDGRGTSRD